jgi:hypothetical protein
LTRLSRLQTAAQRLKTTIYRCQPRDIFDRMEWNAPKTAKLIRLASGSLNIDQIAAALSITRGAAAGKLERLRAAGVLPPSTRPS